MGKPLINLVDNMVKLGTLYRGLEHNDSPTSPVRQQVRSAPPVSLSFSLSITLSPNHPPPPSHSHVLSWRRRVNDVLVLLEFDKMIELTEAFWVFVWFMLTHWTLASHASIWQFYWFVSRFNRLRLPSLAMTSLLWRKSVLIKCSIYSLNIDKYLLPHVMVTPLLLKARLHH